MDSWNKRSNYLCVRSFAIRTSHVRPVNDLSTWRHLLCIGYSITALARWVFIVLTTWPVESYIARWRPLVFRVRVEFFTNEKSLKERLQVYFVKNQRSSKSVTAANSHAQPLARWGVDQPSYLNMFNYLLLFFTCYVYSWKRLRKYHIRMKCNVM